MKIYKTQEEFNREVKDGVFRVDGDVTFEFNLDTPANINARNINAWNINAENINARDINYYAYCIVYDSITCKSYKSRRENALPLTVLDGKVEIKTD